MPAKGWLRARLTLVCLSAPLLGSSLAACQTSQAPEAGDRAQATEQLKRLSSVADIRRDPVSGVISYAAGKDLAVALSADDSYRTARSRNDVNGMAFRFLEAYREEFQIADPSSEFRIGQTTKDDLGFRRVRLRQVFNGLVVVGAELSLQFSSELALTLIQGRYIPTPRVTPEDAKLSPADATGVAAAKLGRNVQLSETELVVYPLPNSRAALAYQITGTKGFTESWRITVDANTGEVLAKESLRYP